MVTLATGQRRLAVVGGLKTNKQKQRKTEEPAQASAKAHKISTAIFLDFPFLCRCWIVIWCVRTFGVL